MITELNWVTDLLRLLRIPIVSSNCCLQDVGKYFSFITLSPCFLSTFPRSGQAHFEPSDGFDKRLREENRRKTFSRPSFAVASLIVIVKMKNNNLISSSRHYRRIKKKLKLKTCITVTFSTRFADLMRCSNAAFYCIFNYFFFTLFSFQVFRFFFRCAFEKDFLASGRSGFMAFRKCPERLENVSKQLHFSWTTFSRRFLSCCLCCGCENLLFPLLQ